ncbi:MAG: hypothetical protein ABI925_10635 [Verrucomicrobiota bacterium]
MKSKQLLFLSVLATMSIFAANAQSPMPIMVPAGTDANVAAPAAQASSSNSDALQPVLKALQEMKTANEEMLKKQEATLQQLDDLQKAAEQLKIFSKRG